MAKYDKLIPENKAPSDCGWIYVSKGSKEIGKIKVGSLKLPNLGPKRYCVGVMSDVHVTDTAASGREKFQRALTYLNSVEKVAFNCIAGDLTSTGTEAQLQLYADYVSTYSPNIEVHATTGNHDVEQVAAGVDFLRPYTGRDLYYSFEHDGDMFVMFGMTGWPSKTGDIFSTASLQWLYELLEANRNRRVFVFEHCPRFDGSGKVAGWPNPTGDLLNNTSGAVFKSLMEHYTNVIWLHGHSHMEFQYQAYCSHVNYDRKFGCHSIHIPSLAMGRELDETGTGYIHTYGESEGYVMDVYENHIMLRGRDFVKEKFLPIATYCIDTTLQTVEANTFTDSTGLINT